MPTSTLRTDSETLDAILAHLERMDRRDRLRTIGSFVRTLFSVIPMLLFLYSMVYLYQHTDDLIKKVSEEAAKQAAAYTQQQSQGILDQFKNVMPKR